MAPTGSFMPGPFGARRLSWMNTTHTRPLFAVFFIDEVDHGYPNTTEGRTRWNNNVAEYELLAAEMTRRDLWREVYMLLVHVENSARRELLPIVPRGVTTYPSHINGPDSVSIPRKDLNIAPHNQCNYDIFRYTLEHGGSPVVPRVVYIDSSGSMTADSIRPGWTDWIDSMPVDVAVEIHNVDGGEDQLPSEAWVTWAIDILRRFV